MATSMPSMDVPLMRPKARVSLLKVRNLCQEVGARAREIVRS
jgi:hypothetical protein